MSEENTSSDIQDRQIIEKSTTCISFRGDIPVKVTLPVKVTHHFPLWECIVAGMGLTLGVFGTIGVFNTIDKYIWPAIKQFLGFG